MARKTEYNMKDDTQLYYCSAGGHLWYYGDDGNKFFYADIGDATDAEIENSIDRYCGCND